MSFIMFCITVILSSLLHHDIVVHVRTQRIKLNLIHSIQDFRHKSYILFSNFLQFHAKNIFRNSLINNLLRKIV